MKHDENMTSLVDILPLIDEYQFIKIKCHGDILYRGQRRFFIVSDIHINIKVLNILYIPDEYEEVPSITICIDKYFG